MNRKLQHSVTALSATAAVFGLLLLAGGPPRPDGLLLSPDMVLVSIDDDAPPADAAGSDDASENGAGQRRHVRRARAALALPYFSFAQGLRRVTGS